MTNIVVRGLAEAVALVTAGLGPTDGTTTQQATAGLVTMFGTLGVTFIPAGAGAAKSVSRHTSIDIDIAVD